MNSAVIGFGSNIDPDINIPRAKELLGKICRMEKESLFVRTKPIGYCQQDDFLNGAVLVRTDKEQSELRAQLKTIEEQLGRVRTSNTYGPRTIDLDIVVWNGTVVDDDFHQRDFLKKAVLEVLPDLKY